MEEKNYNLNKIYNPECEACLGSMSSCQDYKLAMVVLTHASSYPRAMMVILSYAFPAFEAMFCPRNFHHITDITELLKICLG